MDQNTADARLVKGLIARLEMDAGLGVEYAHGVSLHAPPPESASKPVSRPSVPVVPVIPVVPPAPAAPRMMAAKPMKEPAAKEGFISLVPFVEPAPNPEKEAALAALREECMACAACELSSRRNSVVWGEGSLDADVLFIGEGPGRDEDAEGRPFVGRSGRLLTDIIEKGMKIPRSEVYIANVVKCRPPGNRDPKPEEVAACSRYLARQIEVISPKAIVAVGNVAGRALLGLDPKASGLRGKWEEHNGIPMRVIYHPSYLLRQRRNEQDRTGADRTTWMDVREVMAKIAGGAIPVLLCIFLTLVTLLFPGCESVADGDRLDQKGANQSLVEIGERAIERAESFENEGRSAEAHAEYKRALWAFQYHRRLTGEEPFLLDEAAQGVERQGRR